MTLIQNSLTATKSKIYTVIASVSLVLLTDYLTKFWVVRVFSQGQSKTIIENFFELTRIHNFGSAFGFLSEAHPGFRNIFFAVVIMVAIWVIVSLLMQTSREERLQIFALSLILGGAIGNAINRVEFGYVVDFLRFHYGTKYEFPSFNVADIAICTGVGLLLLKTIRNDQLHLKSSGLEVSDVPK